MKPVLFLLPLALLAACAPRPMTAEETAQICEDRARAAAGPTGEVAFGVDSLRGARVGVSVGVTTDFLSGRDPQDIYRACIFDQTGQAPYRPLVLR